MNIKVSTYLSTSFRIWIVAVIFNMLTINIEVGEMSKPLTKSRYSVKHLKNIWTYKLSENYGGINLSNGRVWIQTVFV